MKLYKLTDHNHQTYGGCQWGEGIEHTTNGEGDLCGPGWLHAYTDPLLAVLLNPIHANFKHPVLWEADGDVGKTDQGFKVGCTRLKTIGVMSLPIITNEHRIRFAILCAMKVCTNDVFVSWANKWLKGEDRTAEAARAAVRAAVAEAWAVAEAAVAEAWAVAEAAEEAARAAAWAARAAAWAARAARAAAWAARAAAVKENGETSILDLTELAHKACDI